MEETLVKYCRYCAFCISGDCYYCTCYEKILKNVNKPTTCSEFVMSELGDVDTSKPYKPREPREKKTADTTQITMFEEDNKKNG